jgi:hypothetical protein
LELEDVYDSNKENSFYVTATYDEGSDIYPLKGSWDRYTILVFLIYSVFSALAFAIALRYKDIHESIENWLKRRKQAKFVFQIFEDIVEAKNTFTNDIRSIKFFSTEKWKYYPSENKFLIFSSLEDYLKLDKFYMGLEKRNQLLFANEILHQEIIKFNKSALTMLTMH